MKVPKSYIGCMVKVWWNDPMTAATSVRVEGPPRRGLAGLALQQENGVIDDITDGVIRICHYSATHPGEDQPDEYRHTWVLEDLITRIDVFELRGAPSPAEVVVGDRLATVGRAPQ